MSEFSSSFHIRTTSPPDTEQRLRKAKLSGLVFGPKNDWLTFVPYPDTDGITGSHDDAGMANAIAATTGRSQPSQPLLRFNGCSRPTTG